MSCVLACKTNGYIKFYWTNGKVVNAGRVYLKTVCIDSHPLAMGVTCLDVLFSAGL